MRLGKLKSLYRLGVPLASLHGIAVAEARECL